LEQATRIPKPKHKSTTTQKFETHTSRKTHYLTQQNPQPESPEKFAASGLTQT
jgi:hypothetical protein